MTIPITGLSPSADGKWSFCQQQYFIGYNLKVADKGNQKALMGTIVHKILEILAKAKQSLDKGSKVVNDEVLGGDFTIDLLGWLKPHKLSSVLIDCINQSRADKKVYKDKPFLESGHTRFGYEFVEHIISLCYAWYSNKHTEFVWTKSHLSDVANWTWMVLDYKNGLYDPRNRKIHSTEFSFELPIMAKWAEYKYTMPDGTVKEGNLRLRGIIDLVLDTDDNSIEVVDWKTGQRLDWATGKVKDFASLQQDKQLLIYYYAIKSLYADIGHVDLTIFFVRDGGPFTMCFDKSDLIKIEKHIKERFTQIKNTKVPKLISNNQSNFKCRFCEYSKMQRNGTNLCNAVANEIKLHGIEQVQRNFFEEKLKNEVCTPKS